MQTRTYDFKADDLTRILNRWFTGLHQPGVYFGYDFNPGANMNLQLVHTNTGFKDVDGNPTTPAESAFQGLAITRQGVIIKEDAALNIATIANGAGNPRIDIVIMTHQIIEVAGGQQALYSIIQGTPAASPVAPALTDTVRQIKIGELYIPAGATALNQVGVAWTRSSKPGFANDNYLGAITGAITTVLISNLAPNRAVVSNGAGKFIASSILDTEINQLAGIGATPIITQLTNEANARIAADATKQDIITGAITTVLSSNLTGNRVAVSNGSGKLIASSILDTELNQLAGIGGTPIATQLATKLTAVVDNSTVEISAGTLRVKANGITGSQLSDIAAVKPNGSQTYKIKVVSSGIWNMDTDGSVNAVHGLSEVTFRSINCIIQDNVGFKHPLYRGGYFTTDGTNINLVRTGAGVFDSAGFNAAICLIEILYEA